jgi:23S rRNA (pseudouridine1915-N3)-methyltransferase
MRLLVVTVGKVRGELAAPVREFETRAARYWKLDFVEVRSGGEGSNAAPGAVRDLEADRILARVPSDLEVVAMTREGESMASEELARYLERHAVRSSPGVAFVIGGAHGLAEAVLERGRRRLSLSKMTLPHEMARLVLAEQLYRAGTILRGEPYHKG